MVQLREKLCELEREMEVLRGANETLQMRLERVNMQVVVVVVVLQGNTYTSSSLAL